MATPAAWSGPIWESADKAAVGVGPLGGGITVGHLDMMARTVPTPDLVNRPSLAAARARAGEPPRPGSFLVTRTRRLLLRADQAPKVCCHLMPVEAPVGDLDRQRVPRAAVSGRRSAIQPQEHDAGAEGRSLVAIEERVIPADVEQVGGRDFDDVFEDRFTAKRRLWSGDRGFEQCAITYAVQPAESPNRLGVNLLHDVDAEMHAVGRPRAHDSFFIVRA